MYTEHTQFESPENKNSKIWRYMDFTKFVSLLDTRSLYFTRVDKFQDPYEGLYTKFNKERRGQVYSLEIPTSFFETMEKLSKMSRRYTFVNCWHMNEHESAAMWQLYLQSSEGVAIQTNFKDFCQCFSEEEKSVYIGQVKYIDYSAEWMPEGNTFTPFVYKRKSFEHERELRALVQDPLPRDGETIKIDLQSNPVTVGHSVKVDLDKLIEKIYVSPTAQPWFKELVESILKKYEVKKEVVQSSIFNPPY